MADTTAPTLQRTLPADNATGVSVTGNLGLVFNEAVRPGPGLIKIYKSDGTLFHTIAASDTSQVTVEGRGRVSIDPSVPLLGGTGYYVSSKLAPSRTSRVTTIQVCRLRPRSTSRPRDRAGTFLPTSLRRY